jgi:hypothetical protein
MIPASSEVDDTDRGENNNAEGPRARPSPAGQDPDDERSAVLKNLLY